MLRIVAPVSMLVAAFMCAVAGASGWCILPVPEPSGGPRSALELRQHHIEVSIKDQVAVTRVEQVFYNPSGARVEGEYLFPLPVGAHVDRFSMFIDGEEVEAELLPADKARGIYEGIVRSMKDPALLEYSGQGALRIRVFPIEPQSEKRIRLEYTELLSADAGVITLRTPLRFDRMLSKPIDSVSVRVTATSSDSIKGVYSASHDVQIERSEDGGSAAAVWEAVGALPGSDFHLAIATGAGDNGVGVTLLTHADAAGDEDGYFLLLLTPHTRADEAEIVPKDVVFVMDTSGSMAGAKLEQAKGALRFCLNTLNPGDRFEIVQFSTGVEAVFGSLVENSRENLGRALAGVEAMRAAGMTAIDGALQLAISHASGRDDASRPYVVVFLTDGLANVGVSDPDQIVSRVVGGVGEATARVFCFGVGHDVNTRLLDRLAQETRAVSQYVLPSEDIELKVSGFFAKINDPAMTDLALVVEGDVALNRMHPGALPDLFVGDQLVVLGRYRGDGEATLTLTGAVDGRPRAITHTHGFGAAGDANGFLPRLWAMRRVGYLLDRIRLAGEDDELRAEIVELARKYAIVTPYTSYLIVEDEAAQNIPLTRQTMRRVGGDSAPARELRAAYEESYKQYRDQRSGEAAVAAAQASDALNRAPSQKGLELANALAFRAAPGHPALSQQGARHVNGRAFFENDGVWVDAGLHAADEAERVQVRFDSDEYYALLRAHPEAAAWLSLGRRVEFLLDGKVFEIVD